MRLDSLIKKARGKADDPDACAVGHRNPVLLPDRHPDLAGQLVGQAVKRECGYKAGDRFGHTLGRFGETMVRVEFGVRKLVEPAREADYVAVVLHAAHGGSGDLGFTLRSAERSHVP